MATASVKRALTAGGFRYQREATHGEVWGDGERTIMVSRNATSEHPGFKKDLRNALYDRQKKNPLIKVEIPEEIQEVEEVKHSEPVREPVHEKCASVVVKGPRALPILVMTILTDPELTDGQKVKMIMAYAELE